MKSRLISKSIVGSIVFAFAGFSITTFQIAKGTPQQKQLTPEQEQQIRAHLSEPGGLKRAAQIAEHWTSVEYAAWDGDFDLEGLAAESPYVVVGKAISKKCRYRERDSGDTITTDYEIEVKESLKGSFKDKDHITAVLKGGQIQFEDGTSATILTPDCKKMENGKTYLLFLLENRGDNNALILTGGSQGLFGLSDDGTTVTPYAPEPWRVHNYKNMNVKDFMALVRQHVERHPEVRSCCNQ